MEPGARDDSRALVVVGGQDRLPSRSSAGAVGVVTLGVAAVAALATGGIALARALGRASTRRAVARQEGARAVAGKDVHDGGDGDNGAVVLMTRVSVVVVEEWTSRGRAGGR